MKHTSLLAGALLAAAPLVALSLPGCGGGNGGGLFATPTPTTSPTITGTPSGTNTATPVGTATPTPTQGATQTSNLTLGNGQRATLSFRQSGNAISGTPQIQGTATNTLHTKLRAIPFTITAGTYTFTGTITPPRGYSIQGNLGTFGAFSMTGQLPTTTQTGTYTLTVNGQTDSGTLPIIGQAFPTPTPNPSSGNYKLAGNLAFSNVTSGSSIVPTALTSFNTVQSEAGFITNTTVNGSKYQMVSLPGASGNATGNGTLRTLGVSLVSYPSFTNLKPFTVGQTITPNIATGNLLQLSQTVTQGTSVQLGVWRSTSGTITVKAIGTNSISLELSNVRFEPTQVLGGTGSFTINGTLAATGLTIKTN